jgi:hemoglobin
MATAKPRSKGMTIVADSLYERLGGKDAIEAVVEDFRERTLRDERISQKFVRTDVPRLQRMLVDQVCEATGGPCTYTGRDMKEAHRNMGVTAGEFEALVEDLVASLAHFKVPQAEQDELLGLLGPMRSDIVEAETDETGMPLPDVFEPAPPLE